MRMIILLLLLIVLGACSNVSLNTDDLNLYCNSRIFKPLILPKEVSDKFPRITKQFNRAIRRWEMATPVELHVYDDFSGPRGSISVFFGNYMNMLSVSNNILGFYSPNTKMLFFTDDMENEETYSDDAIYKTCLHELGHVLGLPHIIGKIDDNGDFSYESGSGFDIVLPSKEDAEKCIMYPIAHDEDQTDLSPVEILWARHALMHDINLTSFLENCTYGKIQD